jgi:glycine dehydrogenase subunit 1
MTDAFVHPYLPNSVPAVKAAMLAATDATSVEEFYADVPGALRIDGLHGFPGALPAEQDLADHVTGLLERNDPVPAGRRSRWRRGYPAP